MQIDKLLPSVEFLFVLWNPSELVARECVRNTWQCSSDGNPKNSVCEK